MLQCTATWRLFAKQQGSSALLDRQFFYAELGLVVASFLSFDFGSILHFPGSELSLTSTPNFDDEVKCCIRAVRERGRVITTTITMAAATAIVRSDRNLLSENGGSISITPNWAKFLLCRLNFVKRKGSSTMHEDDWKISRQLGAVYSRH